MMLFRDTTMLYLIYSSNLPFYIARISIHQEVFELWVERQDVGSSAILTEQLFAHRAHDEGHREWYPSIICIYMINSLTKKE